VQLVVHDPLGVIDAPVQSHVETEGEEAHSVGFYEKRAQRAAARAIEAMPHPRWVSARRNQTPSRTILHAIRRTDTPDDKIARPFDAVVFKTSVGHPEVGSIRIYKDDDEFRGAETCQAENVLENVGAVQMKVTIPRPPDRRRKSAPQ
jgi:hypothetical protein